MTQEDSTGQQRPPYPGFWQAVSLLGAMIAIQFLILIPVVKGGFKLGDEKDWRALAVEVPVLVLSTLGALGIAHTWPNANLSQTIQFPAIKLRSWIAIAVSVVGAFVLMEGLQGLQVFATAFHPWLKKEFAEDPFAHLGPVPFLFYGAIVAPVFEELMFRGVILGGFLRRYPASNAIALSALLFALIHLNVTQMLAAFFAGLLLGWWRMQSGGLTAPIIVHSAYNAIATMWTKLQSFPDVYYTYKGLLIATGCVLAGASILVAMAHFYGRASPPPAVIDSQGSNSQGSE